MIEKNIPIRDLYSDQHSVHGPTVATYMRRISSGEVIENVRVVVCPISGNPGLSDGNHRCVAHLLSGKNSINATIETCEWKEHTDPSLRCESNTDICSSWKGDLFGKNMTLSPDEE